MKRIISLLGACSLLFNSFAFELERTSVPRQEIHSGGVPKDGIPALTKPETVHASQGQWLRDSDMVVGVAAGGEARAYPLAILNWHEVVNDKLGTTALAVTYCPLADSVAIFDRATSKGIEREFGVSGLLYNSNLIMYEKQKIEKLESLWSQVKTEAIAGPRMGEKLKSIPHAVVTWKQWRESHPDTTVLTAQTGYTRNYRQNPYESYFASAEVMFPVKPQSLSLRSKDKVIGILYGGSARAYPFSELGKIPGPVTDEIHGQPVTITFDHKTKAAFVSEMPPTAIVITSFWFAWYAMHPTTDIWLSTGVVVKPSDGQ